MKSSNTIVTVVIVGAVLVAAYAVGLLIRQARMGDSASSVPPAAEVNEAQVHEDTAKLSHQPGTGGTQDSQQARAELKNKREEALQKMDSATEEEKEQFREKVRERFSAEPGDKTVRRGSVRKTEAVQILTPQDPNAQPHGEKAGSDPNSR